MPATRVGKVFLTHSIRNMKITLLSLGLVAMMLACQEKQKPTDKTETAQTETIKTDNNIALKENLPAKPAADYAKLILGKWVQPEQGGFQPWAAYDAEKVYGDGNEQGTEYEVKGDKLIYRVLGGGEPAEYKILTLNEKELAYQIDKDRKETWTREEKKEAKKPTAIDAKLLKGTWVNEKAEDEFSKQRVYKSNGKWDMTPFNDVGNYQVVGNKIKYTQVFNGGADYEDVITSLTKTELVIDGNLKFKRIK